MYLPQELIEEITKVLSAAYQWREKQFPTSQKIY